MSYFKKIFNEFDLKLFNLSAWMTIIIAYITPYRVEGDFKKLYGLPFSFFKTHELAQSKIPLVGNSLDLFRFLIDVIIIYTILTVVKRIAGRHRDYNA